jgi:hypothetical protein
MEKMMKKKRRKMKKRKLRCRLSQLQLITVRQLLQQVLSHR